MSVNNKFISNEQATPIASVNRGLYADIADQGSIIYLGYGLDTGSVGEPLVDSYLRLRKNVYVDQTGMLPCDADYPNGHEIDRDDDRSAHFIAVTKKSTKFDLAIVGCMRFIIRGRDSDWPLPIEDFFPESFPHALSANDLEVSRLISVTGGRRVPSALFDAGIAYITQNQLGDAYGVVEPTLEKSLQFFGAPSARVAEPKMVPEYNDVNLGVKINLDAMRKRVGYDAIMAYNFIPGVANTIR